MEIHEGVTAHREEQGEGNSNPRKGLLASGSVIGAILTSSCCILPLVLLSLGIGGAWTSHLTALAPYQPYILIATMIMLGAGFYAAYRKPRNVTLADTCDMDGYCGTPLADKVIKTALWSATAIIVLALAWPYIAPFFLR